MSEGRTTVSESVVSTIVLMAAGEVAGVHRVGLDHAPGVSVVVDGRRVAVGVSLVAEYGVAIDDLVREVRRSVRSFLEQMTGLQVTDVDIAVVDLRLPSVHEQSGRPDRS